MTAYCRLAMRHGAVKNTFVRSPHPTNKGAENRSWSALLSAPSPTGLCKTLTKRTGTSSTLLSPFTFSLSCVFFLLLWCQETSKTRPTVSQKLRSSRSAFGAALMPPSSDPFVPDPAGWRQKCCTCAQAGTGAARTPGHLVPTPLVIFYLSKHVKAAASACVTYLPHPSW